MRRGGCPERSDCRDYTRAGDQADPRSRRDRSRDHGTPAGLSGSRRLGDGDQAAGLADGGDARVLRRPRADFLAVATPGAGKTTFALTVAAELLGRRMVDRITVVAPTEHLKTQWAEAAARAGIPIDPTYAAGKGKTSQGLRRHRGDLRRRRGQPARACGSAPSASRRW